MLRKIRIVFSLLFFCGINLFFLNRFDVFGGLTKIQFISAVLSVNILVLAFLLLLAIMFGRLYCSSICPLGIFQDITIWLSRKKSRKKNYSFSKAKNILRYALLAAAAVCLIIGFNIAVAFVEPYSLYGGIAAHLLKPVWLALNNILSALTFKLDLYLVYRQEIIEQSILSILISAVFFIGIGATAWRYGRTWCNTVCPVGSLLGIISRFALFKISINAEKCTDCGLCEKKCKASCIESKEHRIDYSRCIDCFDCVDVCSKNAISFSPVFKNKTVKAPSGAAFFAHELTGSAFFSRKSFIGISLTAAAGFFAASFRASLLAAAFEKRQKIPVAPPGVESISRFTNLCTSCHLCVSKCPEQVLVPASSEYGISGIMQPTMKFNEGSCDYECNICGQVCPTQAIRPLPLKEKQKVQAGFAVFNQADCIIVKDNVKCKNCVSHCPTKAIKLQDTGGKILPVIDKDKCIGCGACEYYCPAKPLSAIYVDGYDVQKKLKS